MPHASLCRLTPKDFVELRDTLNGLGHPRSAKAPDPITERSPLAIPISPPRLTA
jgi:hypothetical protein